MWTFVRTQIGFLSIILEPVNNIRLEPDATTSSGYLDGRRKSVRSSTEVFEDSLRCDTEVRCRELIGIENSVGEPI